MNERKGFLLLLIGVLGFVSYLMLKPFIGYVLGALILSFVFFPVQKRLEKFTGERISAFSLVILSIVAAILPFSVAGAVVIQDAADITSDLQDSEGVNTTQIEQDIERYTGRSVNISESVDSSIDQFVSVTVGSVSRFVGLITDISIGLTLMLFLQYYFLKDGPEIVEWFKGVIPLDGDVEDNLVERIGANTSAVIKGHVFVAIAQGLIAGIGLFLTGVPNPGFWTFAMVLLGFIPLIGTIIVWAPAAAYLFVIGNTFASILLAVYGLTVVGLTDNILRPIVVEREGGLHPGAVLIGVIGGVYFFGVAGLFIGPIIIGALKATLLVFKNNYEDL